MGIGDMTIYFFEAIHNQVLHYALRPQGQFIYEWCVRVWMRSKNESVVLNFMLKRLIELADLKKKYARNAQNDCEVSIHWEM